MAMLFRSVRLTVISVVTNALPLLVVGATMGYFAIALKPSTALIFSLAFGIAVDDTIHVLALYRILMEDRKSTRLNSSHVATSYAVFCLKKKTYTKKHNDL